MTTIKPFQAIQPNPIYVGQLVFPGEEKVVFSGIHKKENSLRPLKELLEGPARQRLETDDGRQQAYRKIEESLQNLLATRRLLKDEKPGIYIYEIVHHNYRQTGVWALTSVKNYANGNIKIHEQTLAESEQRIADYRKYTRLEASPVLLTYKPNAEVNRIIGDTCAGNKRKTIGNGNSRHRIWKIEDEKTLDQLISAFANVNCVYMADGHHRLAGTARIAQENMGSEYISSLLIASDQLRTLDYHRIFAPRDDIQEDEFIEKLQHSFSVYPSPKPVKPESPHIIGLCIKNKWYKLTATDKTRLGVVLLQDKILSIIFHLNNPRSDERLKCIGGENALGEVIGFLKQHPTAIAFTLCPISVNELIKAADSATILPPKSTWIAPKIPYGLLIFQHPI